MGIQQCELGFQSATGAARNVALYMRLTDFDTTRPSCHGGGGGGVGSPLESPQHDIAGRAGGRATREGETEIRMEGGAKEDEERGAAAAVLAAEARAVTLVQMEAQREPAEAETEGEAPAHWLRAGVASPVNRHAQKEVGVEEKGHQPLDCCIVEAALTAAAHTRSDPAPTTAPEPAPEPAAPAAEPGEPVAAAAAQVSAAEHARQARRQRMAEEPPPLLGPLRLQKGTVVAVNGLVGAPQYNRRPGVICGWNEAKGRYHVQMGAVDELVEDSGGNRPIALKPANLTAASDSESDESESDD